MPKFPFVWRSEHERLVEDHTRIFRENAELRNALKNANAELLKSRQFIAGIRSGNVDVIGALDRVRRGAFS